jgi:hypothetical protein
MAIAKSHTQALRDSGISNKRILARGYSTIRRDEAGADLMDELGFSGMATWDARRPGLLIPLHDKAGEIWGYQYKSDHPRVAPGRPLKGREGKTKYVKYENPRFQTMRLDFPMGLMAKLADRDAPLIVTEGAKKADSAMTAGYPTLCLLGVAIWKTPACLEDWEGLPLRGRDVYICFDSDAVTKVAVQTQERQLAVFLMNEHRALVHICRLKPTRTGEKVGLDDFIAAGGDVDKLLASAKPFRVTQIAAAR